MSSQTVPQDGIKKESKGKRFLLGLLYWALLVLVAVLAYYAESMWVGIILSAILAVVYLIYPKRKGIWFWWWFFMAVVFVGWYIYNLIKFGGEA